MKKGRGGKRLFCRSGVGEVLVQSLTAEQIAHLLDVMLAGLDVGQYAQGLKQADPDMAETVERVLKMDGGEIQQTGHTRVASNQKTLEYWNLLWSRWDDVVADVGDEKGKYSVQDAHWEPPYFDRSALAEDLDKIARDMLGIIDNVFDLVKNPNIFLDAIEEIDSNISSYPEWMGEEDGCMLGKNTTRCVLKWLWMRVSRDAHPGSAFLRGVFELEEEFDLVDLDDDECVAFFGQLPDEVCREIYECLNKGGGEKIGLHDIYSKWHKINHIYQKRFDSARYLETCEHYLAENWEYGKPLIDEALRQGNWQKTELLLQQTFSSYLGADKKGLWYPERSLLLTERNYYHADDEEEVAGLLKAWEEVSKHLDNPGRAAASRLQSVICRAPEDWDTIIGNYKELWAPELKGIVDPLFSAWQGEMAQRSICVQMDNKILSDTWIHWLIEAELDESRGKEWFLKRLGTWLDDIKEDEERFKRQWLLLARLTKDLPGSDNLQNLYPTFFKVVLPSHSSPSLLDKARCERLKKMAPGDYLSISMDVWNVHLGCIMPDPTRSYKSNYKEHAEWMRALYELSQAGYEAVIRQWHKVHKQRRNLWRDMRKQQLPLSEADF